MKQRKYFLFGFLKKNRVRWNFNTVFGFKKTVLDRIPGYKRTVLKEECLYKIQKDPLDNKLSTSDFKNLQYKNFVHTVMKSQIN